MVWHFDFCAGFLPNDVSFNTNRYLIYGILATHVLTFTIIKMIAGCTWKGRAVVGDEEDQNNCGETTMDKLNGYNIGKKDQSDQLSEVNHEKLGSNDSTFNNSTPPGSRELMTRRKNKGRCMKFFQNIDIDQMERLFSIFFGHHAICVGVCLMYCPYFPITIICVVYLFLGLLLFFFINSKYKKPIPWVWGFACFLNLALFFGSATFVGLANYDPTSSKCYAEIIEL